MTTPAPVVRYHTRYRKKREAYPHFTEEDNDDTTCDEDDGVGLRRKMQKCLEDSYQLAEYEALATDAFPTEFLHAWLAAKCLSSHASKAFLQERIGERVPVVFVDFSHLGIQLVDRKQVRRVIKRSQKPFDASICLQPGTRVEVRSRLLLTNGTSSKSIVEIWCEAKIVEKVAQKPSCGSSGVGTSAYRVEYRNVHWNNGGMTQLALSQEMRRSCTVW